MVPEPVVVFNAFPNPFNPTVNFEIKAEDYENLQIEIFNIKGQKVETISTLQITQSPNHQITWNAEDYASGVYFCKLVNVGTDNILTVKKVTLLK